MEINTNLNAGKVGAASADRPSTRAKEIDRDNVKFEGVANLEKALQEVPDKRTEQIARAVKLVGDPTYPPKETLDRIANLLAMRDSVGER